MGNESALGIAPIVEKRKIAALVMAQHPKAGAGYRYVIRFVKPAEDYSQATRRYLAGEGIRRIQVVSAQFRFLSCWRPSR